MRDRQPTEIRRAQIADAALTLLGQGGLKEFTTSALASVVGLSEGAIFRHFPSKTEIVLAVIQAIEARLFEGFPPTEGDPLERLGAFVQRRVRLLVEHPAIMRLIFSDQLAQASGAAGIALFRRMQARSLAFIRDRLGEAQAAGLLREGLSPDLLTLVVYGSVFGASNRALYGQLLSPEVQRRVPDDIWPTLAALLRR